MAKRPPATGVQSQRAPLRGAWIETSAASAAATKVAKALVKHPVWKNALSGALPSTQTAILVQRLDHPDDYYYIVAFESGGRTTARMAIGGRDAQLLRCNAISRAGSRLPPFVTPTGVLKSREGKPFGIGPARERLMRRAAVGVHPVLVWKPCAESRSPLLPFYLLTVGDTVSYLRVDGKLYTVLRVPEFGR